MAAANGFVTVSPDARYGDAEGSFPASFVLAAKFTAPGSGALNITEIGIYSYSSSTGHLHLAIWTHDAGNDCPESIVANSDTGEFASTGSMAKLSHSYGTEPVLTGGNIYWLTFIGDFDNAHPSRFASGGNAVYVTGITYPTWPTGTQWESHTDQTVDYSLYAVYETAPSGGLSLPIAMAYYSRIRRTSGD